MEDLFLFNRNIFFWGGTQVITLNQKFLGIILFFLYTYLKLATISFLCENAVEGI